MQLGPALGDRGQPDLVGGSPGANNRCRRVPSAERTKKTNLYAGRAWGRLLTGSAGATREGRERGEARC